MTGAARRELLRDGALLAASCCMGAVVTSVRVMVSVVAFAASAHTAAAWKPVAASSLLGLEVVDVEGRRVGEVRDLLLDMQNARVEYGLVDTGGRVALIPATRLRADVGARRLELQRADVDAAPAGREPGTLVRASRLDGWRVTDRTGRYAGEIEDVVIDPRNNVVLHVLFDYDESWGPDQPPLRLAPQVFRFSLKGGPAVVNIRRARLEDPDHTAR